MRRVSLQHVVVILILTFLASVIGLFVQYQNKSRKNAAQFISSFAAQPLPNVFTAVKTESEVSPPLSNEKLTKNENIFGHYSSDNYFRSLLRRQATSQGQVIATIIGGDAYPLFAWDWYERMRELSNDTGNCHCFVVAMDEISLVLAVKRGIPVYYSTFSFDEQMRWINTIEVRQHSLYRVGHAKFHTAFKVVQLGYAVFLTEMDVFWRANPLDHLRQPMDAFDLQISDHGGSHPRVNIGLFYVRPTNASLTFFSHVSQFWIRFGKGAYLSDQRVVDALLNNYDRLDLTYRRVAGKTPSLNWTKHFFGNQFSHMMTDGNAFELFDRAARAGLRSKKFYGDANKKYFTVIVDDKSMTINQRGLLLRALLILQYTHLSNRTFILPGFTSNVTTRPLTTQMDIKKFLLYWTEEHIRLPNFFLLNHNGSLPVTYVELSLKRGYDDVNGVLVLSLKSVPLDLPSPSPDFEALVRDSLFLCLPPSAGGAWCVHHPRDFGLTAELLFACRGDPYPPCANKTEINEIFLERPFERKEEKRTAK